jgi:hypothetical protein
MQSAALLLFLFFALQRRKEWVPFARAKEMNKERRKD